MFGEFYIVLFLYATKTFLPLQNFPFPVVFSPQWHFPRMHWAFSWQSLSCSHGCKGAWEINLKSSSIRAGVSQFNIQSSFTVQNPRTQLVKIEHVILLYLTSANSDSALLTITHKNRALLTMADFFVNVFSL